MTSSCAKPIEASNLNLSAQLAWDTNVLHGDVDDFVCAQSWLAVSSLWKENLAPLRHIMVESSSEKNTLHLSRPNVVV